MISFKVHILIVSKKTYMLIWCIQERITVHLQLGGWMQSNI